MGLKPRKPKNIFKYLRDATGSINATVDGSMSPITFRFVPENDAMINRILVYIEAQNRMASNGYGDIPNGLERGMRLEWAGGEEVFDLLDSTPIQSNGQWAAKCYDSTPITFDGGGLRALSVRWTLGNSGKPLRLDKGSELRAVVQDDLRTLVTHRFQIQGYWA